MALDGRSLDAARREVDITVYELWVAYVSLGGGHDAFVLKRHLDGTLDDDEVAPLEREMMQRAVNEVYADLGLPTPFPC